MRWSSFLASAVILTGISVASADDFGRLRPATLSRQPVSDPFQAPAADYYADTMRAGAFADFPAYPIGYTNYRGLGFWGTCCEKNPPCTEDVWDGYCAQRGCGNGGFAWKGRACGQKGCGCRQKGCGCRQKGCGCGQKGHGCGQKGCGCRQKGCGCGCGQKSPIDLGGCCYHGCFSSSCGGIGANWWVTTPKLKKQRHKGLGCKLRRLQDQCLDMIGLYPDDGCTDCQSQYATSPTPAAPSPTAGDPSPTMAAPLPAIPEPNPANPTPAKPKPQLPAPETSTDFSDELPPLSSQDKSARRVDMRRLPTVLATY